MASMDFGLYKRLVQGFFDPEPKNNDVSSSTIWCLGREYTSSSAPNGVSMRDPHVGLFRKSVPPSQANGISKGAMSTSQAFFVNDLPKRRVEAQEDSNEEEGGWPTEFLDDCDSRIWLTYRSHFPPIKKSSDALMTLSVRLRSLADQQAFTSDTGWGYWRRGARVEEEKQLLSLFADDPNAPFSIHRFVEHGAVACGKHPGEWFGPSATARCIQALSHTYEKAGLNVYVNGDGADVYENKFLRLAKQNSGRFTNTIILLGIRLGIDRVTPAYWDALKASLELPQSIGIAGGRPSSSHYFFAHQGNYFFYLDPHFTRPALPLHPDPVNYTTEEVQSCHTRRLRRLALNDMDPSMLLAFIITDEEDWRRWKEWIKAAPGKAVVHIADTEPSLHGHGTERQGALDEVETFDDEIEDEGNDDDGPILEHS